MPWSMTVQAWDARHTKNHTMHVMQVWLAKWNAKGLVTSTAVSNMLTFLNLQY